MPRDLILFGRTSQQSACWLCLSKPETVLCSGYIGEVVEVAAECITAHLMVFEVALAYVLVAI